VDVEVDADCCGGFGQCVTICPEVFELTDAGYAVVLLPDVPEELEAAVHEAVVLCPTHAISITPSDE
jgi:ferredoxin